MSKTSLHGQQFEVEITDTTIDGKGVARIDDKVFFVSNAIPGDVVKMEVVSRKRRYFEARTIEIIQPSVFRTTPVCKHFGICGGCKWQHMTYEAQLQFKEKQVIDQFERLGKIFAPHRPIQPSPDTYFYRNKLEFTFSTRKWFISSDDVNEPVLGFHIPGRFDKVLDIQECYLQPKPSNEIRNFVRKLTMSQSMPYYDLKTHEGFLRNLIIRTNASGECLVILSVKYVHEEWITLIAERIKQEFPEIVSFYVAVNPKLNDVIDNAVELKLFFGKEYLTENILGMQYNVSPKAFMQVNIPQTHFLYQKILDYASLMGNETVMDLYCGIGTISLLLSKHSKQVIGIEYIEEAVNDAKQNARLNKIDNAVFYAGDVKDFLKSDECKAIKPEIIVLDPPRSGVHPEVIAEILRLKPKKIIYVSCNAATQARDINLLISSYNVTEYQPYDMFPQTSHVENIALLEIY